MLGGYHVAVAPLGTTVLPVSIDTVVYWYGASVLPSTVTLGWIVDPKQPNWSFQLMWRLIDSNETS